MSVSHSYVFIGEASVHAFCPFSDMIICFVCVEFEEFSIDPGYQPFAYIVICQYLLPFPGLPLCFLTVSIAVQKLLILRKSPKFTFAFDSFALGDIS